MTTERLIIISAFIATALFYGSLYKLCVWCGRRPQAEEIVEAQWFEDEESPAPVLRFPTRDHKRTGGEVWYEQRGLVRRREDES